MMGIVVSETCSAYKKYNKIISGIQLVLFLSYHNDVRSNKHQATFSIYIAKRCFYIACHNNYMFRPVYRPSSGCTLSCYTANNTIFTFLLFDVDLVHIYKILCMLNNYNAIIMIIIISMKVGPFDPFRLQIYSCSPQRFLVFQLFSFLVIYSGMISKGYGFVAFFASVKASSVCIHLCCLICL